MDACPTKDQMKAIWRFRLTNLLYGCATAVVGFYVLFLESTGLPPSQVGNIMSVNSFLGAIAPPLWGLISDKLRSRYRVFLLSALASTLTIGLLPLSAQFKIFGIVSSAFLLPATSFFRFPGFSMIDTMSMEACNRVNGVEYSSIRVWRSIGMTVMNIIYSFFVSRIGPGFVFYGFVFFMGLVFFMRSHLKKFDPDDAHLSKPIPLRELQVSRLFKNYYLAVFLLLQLLLMVAPSCGMYLPYLLEAVGGDKSIIGVVNGIRTAANVCMMFASPYLKRKFGMPMILVGASALLISETLLYQICSSQLSVILTSTLGGAAMGLVLSSGINYVSLMAPKGLEATAISLYAIGYPTTGIVANLLGGQLIERFGAKALYLLGFGATALWLALFLLSFFIGQRVLKKMPPIPLLPPLRAKKQGAA